jgi:hypothetical protein
VIALLVLGTAGFFGVRAWRKRMLD